MHISTLDTFIKFKVFCSHSQLRTLFCSLVSHVTASKSIIALGAGSLCSGRHTQEIFQSHLRQGWGQSLWNLICSLLHFSLLVIRGHCSLAEPLPSLAEDSLCWNSSAAPNLNLRGFRRKRMPTNVSKCPSLYLSK